MGEPYEAQYLKLYDVTPPPAPSVPGGPNLQAYVIGNNATFTWSPALDPDGGISGYHFQLGSAPGSSDLFDGTGTGTSRTFTNLAGGSVVYARVSQINNAGIEGSYSASSVAITVLDPSADQDGDGQSNAAEQTAGTNPFDAASVLRATAIARIGNDTHVTIATVPGKTYQLETSILLTTPSWSNVGGTVTATASSTVFIHEDGAGDDKRFYRARVVP